MIVKCPKCEMIFPTTKDPKSTVSCPKRNNGCGHKFRISTHIVVVKNMKNKNENKQEQKSEQKEQKGNKQEQYGLNLNPRVLITAVNTYLKAYRRAYERVEHDMFSETRRKYEEMLLQKSLLEDML